MNDGHILVIIIAAFIVVQTIAVGIFKYLRALADLKTMEAADVVRKARSRRTRQVVADARRRAAPARAELHRSPIARDVGCEMRDGFAR